MTSEPLRILAIHAHPDDETLYTGGTLAFYAQGGADVSVLTCTLGEEGEVIGDKYAKLVAADGGADQLGGYRIHELTNALAALGAGEPQFLGGAGCYRDSGMLGTAANEHPRAFLKADAETVAEQMACWIRRIRPHAVLVYDEGGTYGHPDHVKAHKCGVRAVELAADHADPNDDVIGSSGVALSSHIEEGSSLQIAPAWDTPRVYCIMQSECRLAAGLDAIADHIPEAWKLPSTAELFCTADDDTTAVVELDEPAYLSKLAALRAHATQATVHVPEDGPVSFALSNNIAQPLLHTEEFRLIRNSH
ncbi:MAG: N-acetyl-1-D-myo-inositol-2-amino-2-deoxy-alpha-D-glucopyranoside deacetylase [Lawsonella sp.]